MRVFKEENGLSFLSSSGWLRTPALPSSTAQMLELDLCASQAWLRVTFPGFVLFCGAGDSYTIGSCCILAAEPRLGSHFQQPSQVLRLQA